MKLLRTIKRLMTPQPKKDTTRIFKRCLARVKTTASVARTDNVIIIEIRPINVDRFKELIDEQGLADDKVSQRMVRYLRHCPAAGVRYQITR